MEEKPEDNNPVALCEECKVNSFKYKCPGCSLRSCSLPCVNSHKRRTGCTGKRTLTNFVPISQFDDSLLLSDYNMLEDVKRIADSAQRTRVKLCGDHLFQFPFRLKSLRNAAYKRGTKLLFLANGMSKRQENRSYYNTKSKFISWTIEWRFHSTDVVLVDHRVHENEVLSSVLEKHLKPSPWNHLLRQFSDQTLESLKFFVRKYPKGSKSPYHQLNINAAIREQLANIVILEYPTIHVFLPSHKIDFDVINVVAKPKEADVEVSHQDCSSPEGVTFKEEEIEDAGYPNPHISDLENTSKRTKTEEVHKKLGCNSPDDEATKHTGSESTHIHQTEDNSISFEQLYDISSLDFDFEPGLMNVSTDLIMGIDPDDFLDFNGILANQKGPDGGDLLISEELEEGEIA